MTATPSSDNEGGIDPWQLAGVPGGLRLASYLTAPGAAQYRLIVDTLLDRQQLSLTGVSEPDLETRLDAQLTALAGIDGARRLLTDFSLATRMAQLEHWGVVDRWDDRATDVFLQNSNRYQLTPAAAQFHRAVRRLGEDIASSVAATFAPSVLTSQLRDMRAALGVDPAALAEAWSVIQTTLNSMADAAAGWQAKLAGALAGAPDPDKVNDLKDTLRRYVDMWGAGVDSHSESIADTAAELLAAGAQDWQPAALHSLGADAEQHRLDELTQEYRATLQTLLLWFGPGDNQSRRLRRQMRDVIAPMVRGQRTLAAVGGHVSRRTELLTLAGALEGCDSDTDAWQLWCTATGLFSARHLGTASPQPGGAAGAVSFWDAPPAPVEARLRKNAAHALSGKPARIPDRSAAKAAARARAAADRNAAARTRHAVQARSGLRLSQWRDLDTAQLDTLLTFLTTIAAAAPSRDGNRRCRTPDGLWDLHAEPAPPGRPAAVIHTGDGRLVHPDVRITIIGASDTLLSAASP